MTTFSHAFKARLSRLMAERFSLAEISGLCADLGVNYDELPGNNLSSKIRELIAYLDRRDRLQFLLDQVQEARPHMDWPVPADDGRAEPPFKGLEYFNEDDESIFFGRRALVEELVAHLGRHRFLAVLGASGSGKSSVVRAGLVPALRRGAVTYQRQVSDRWRVHIITPGDRPLTALATELTRAQESVTAAKTLLTDLHADIESLDLWLRREVAPKNRLFLLVDQFEELYTQCEDADERRLFVGSLVQAVQSGRPGRLSLVLTLRADFYSSAVQDEALVPLLETRQRIVEAMKAEELRQAIEGPVEGSPWHYQAGLVDTVMQDLGAGEGRSPEPGALPLLSHALLETWRRREGQTLTLAGYLQAGGVRKAIARTADGVYRRLTAHEQAIARNIFLRLTELGEGSEDTRRRTKLVELIPQAEQAEEVRGVLAQLAEARLVTTGEDSAEVAHEALIREWPTLRDWLDEDRERLRLLRHVTAEARAWQENGQDSSFLFRGARLAQTEPWLEENEIGLSELERAFLEASLAERTRKEVEQERARQEKLEQAERLAVESEARRKAEADRATAAEQVAQEQSKRATQLRIGASVLFLLLLAATGTALFALDQREAARTQAKVANARYLIGEGQTLFEQEPQLGLALVASGRELLLGEGELLEDLLQDSYERVLRHGRLEELISVDGLWQGNENLLEAGASAEIKQDGWFVVEYALGDSEMRRLGPGPGRAVPLSGHVDEVWESANSEWLLVDYVETEIPGEMRRWGDEVGGRITLSGHVDKVWESALGEWFVVKYVDAETRYEMRRWGDQWWDAIPLKGEVKRVWESADGQWLVVDYDDAPGEMRRWGDDEGKVIPLLGEVRGVWQSADGEWFVVGYLDAQGEMRRWGEGSADAIPLKGSAIGVWEAANGEWLLVSYFEGTGEMRRWGEDPADAIPLKGSISWVRESPNGEWFLIDYYRYAHGEMRRWGKDQSDTVPIELERNIRVLRESPDGEWLVIGYSDAPGEMRRWGDEASGRISLSGHVDQVWESANGEWFVVDYVEAGTRDEMRRWGEGPTDAAKLKTWGDPVPLQGEVDWVRKASNGEWFVVAYTDAPSEVRRWDDAHIFVPLSGTVNELWDTDSSEWFLVDYDDHSDEMRRWDGGSGVWRPLFDKVSEAWVSANGEFAIDYSILGAELWKGYQRVFAFERQWNMVGFSTDNALLWNLDIDQTLTFVDLPWLVALAEFEQTPPADELVDMACERLLGRGLLDPAALNPYRDVLPEGSETCTALDRLLKQ